MTGQTSIITEKNYAFRVPKVPVLLPLNQATDANQGAVGYATNGVAIFGPYNSGCCDATFEEIQTVDYCLGHPANGAYHYHYFSKENFIILIYAHFRRKIIIFQILAQNEEFLKLHLVMDFIKWY